LAASAWSRRAQAAGQGAAADGLQIEAPARLRPQGTAKEPLMSPTVSSLARLLALSALALHACFAQAQGSLRLSGFASLVVGKVLGGDSDTLSPTASCPCFIADWGHGGVYGPRWQAKQESKLGAQAVYTLTPALSATAQVVGRGVDGIKADLEWAFVSWKAAPGWELQVGRKRLPLYFYSDFQDVGYAYPWVRVPPDVYGWDIVNYDGANLSYATELGGWTLRANAYAGSSRSKDNLYTRFYYADRQDVAWKAMRGADIEFANDWLTLRANYHRSRASQLDYSSGTAMETIDPSSSGHDAYGLAANAELGNWLIRTEAGVFDRSKYLYKARFHLVGAGYRIGKFTPMLTVSGYREIYPDPADAALAQKFATTSLTLRYEVTASMALKFQYDALRDSSIDRYNGSSRVVAVSLDTVF
jgi:hypothetical protein